MYVDSSALLKVYLTEPEGDEVEQLLDREPDRSTARITLIEVRRNLKRLLRGAPLARSHAEFQRDWERLNVVEIDGELCGRAAEVAELTAVRTLDAIHLAAIERVGGPLLTYDRRQAEAARSLGWDVVGAA